MPELPEVEAARRALEKIAKGRTISKVSVYEDPIVFSGVTHASFATAIEGKDVREVRRKGKQFYMVLDSGPHPLFHFGMAGYSQTKGESGPSYRVPRATTDPLEWPPKYAKVCITFSDADGKEVGKWAFSDARRLGRVKLITAEVPEEGETLSSLGRDPLLDMIPVAELSVILTKRNAPIKAVLLDQNGPIAGLGNWMVDEILYQSQLHPSHPASALTVDDVATLHKQILEVTLAAVEANADSDLFPKHWLFSSRWGKGKNGKDKFILPSGEETSITFMTVAGRTSAVVEAVQKLPAGVKIKAKKLAKKRKVEEEVSEGEPVPADEIETESPHFKRRMTSLVSASPEGSPSRTPATFKLPLASPSRAQQARKKYT